MCSRCVRACEEVQGTFALTIEGRGFGSRVAAGAGGSFLESDCVSCGACVQVCPTATLTEKSIIEMGQPRRIGHHHVRLLRCRVLVQGRDAGRDRRAHDAVQERRRQRGPLVREGPLRLGLRHAPRPRARADDPRVASTTSGSRLVGRGDRVHRRPAARHPAAVTATRPIGGITSSRCTNEEVFVVQKHGAHRVRQQQRRHLRPRLPLADRLRPQAARSARRPARRTSSRSSSPT